jgi:hypothetical protein
MNTQARSLILPPERTISLSFLAKAVIFFLLFSVAGLATVAKNAQYYPESDPASYVSLATKMNVAHSPVHIVGDQLQPAVTLVAPRLFVQVLRAASPPVRPVLRIGLIVSMQHRSPPARLV